MEKHWIKKNSRYWRFYGLGCSGEAHFLFLFFCSTRLCYFELLKDELYELNFEERSKQKGNQDV